MGSALVLGLVLAGVTAFVWGFVLQEEGRPVRTGFSRVAGLPGRLRHSEATTALGPTLAAFGHAVVRGSLAVAHGAERVGRGLRSLVEWTARMAGVIRERRRIVAEERARVARLNFEETFFQTTPVAAGVARQAEAPVATAFSDPETKSSRLLAAFELMVLIAIGGGIVAGAIFGASHVVAHVLAHFRPG